MSTPAETIAEAWEHLINGTGAVARDLRDRNPEAAAALVEVVELAKQLRSAALSVDTFQLLSMARRACQHLHAQGVAGADSAAEAIGVVLLDAGRGPQ